MRIYILYEYPFDRIGVTQCAQDLARIIGRDRCRVDNLTPQVWDIHSGVVIRFINQNVWAQWRGQALGDGDVLICMTEFTGFNGRESVNLKSYFTRAGTSITTKKLSSYTSILQWVPWVLKNQKEEKDEHQ